MKESFNNRAERFNNLKINYTTLVRMSSELPILNQKDQVSYSDIIEHIRPFFMGNLSIYLEHGEEVLMAYITNDQNVLNMVEKDKFTSGEFDRNEFLEATIVSAKAYIAEQKALEKFDNHFFDYVENKLDNELRSEVKQIIDAHPYLQSEVLEAKSYEEINGLGSWRENVFNNDDMRNMHQKVMDVYNTLKQG